MTWNESCIQTVHVYIFIYLYILFTRGLTYPYIHIYISIYPYIHIHILQLKCMDMWVHVYTALHCSCSVKTSEWMCDGCLSLGQRQRRRCVRGLRVEGLDGGREVVVRMNRAGRLWDVCVMDSWSLSSNCRDRDRRSPSVRPSADRMIPNCASFGISVDTFWSSALLRPSQCNAYKRNGFYTSYNLLIFNVTPVLRMTAMESVFDGRIKLLLDQ